MPLGKIRESMDKIFEGIGEAIAESTKSLNYKPAVRDDEMIQPAKGEDLATFNDSLKSQGYSREQRRRLLSINRKRSKKR